MIFKTQIHALAIVCLCTLTIMGCGGEKAAEKAIETGLSGAGQTADVKIDESAQTLTMNIADAEKGSTNLTMNMKDDNMQMTIEGPDGAMHMQSTPGGGMQMQSGVDGLVSMQTGAGATIPEQFPKDIPLLPDMKVEMAMDMGDGNFSVSALVPGSLDEAVAFYKKACGENGWKETVNMSQDGEESMRMLGYEKEERSFNLVITASDEGTRVGLTAIGG